MSILKDVLTEVYTYMRRPSVGADLATMLVVNKYTLHGTVNSKNVKELISILEDGKRSAVKNEVLYRFKEYASIVCAA